MVLLWGSFRTNPGCENVMIPGRIPRAMKVVYWYSDIPDGRSRFTMWWFQIFFLSTPIRGNDPISRAYVSNGLLNHQKKKTDMFADFLPTNSRPRQAMWRPLKSININVMKEDPQPMVLIPMVLELHLERLCKKTCEPGKKMLFGVDRGWYYPLMWGRWTTTRVQIPIRRCTGILVLIVAHVVFFVKMNSEVRWLWIVGFRVLKVCHFWMCVKVTKVKEDLSSLKLTVCPLKCYHPKH